MGTTVRPGLSVALVLSTVLGRQLAAQEATSLWFDIPAQELNRALEIYGNVTNEQIAYPNELVRGRLNTPLKGLFTPEAALRLLLSNEKDLQVYRRPSGVFVIAAAERVAAERARAAIQASDPNAVAVAAAQPAQQPDHPGGERVLEQIIVTAQKREETLQDVPISVSVLSGAQLGAAQVSSVVDLVRVSPSISFQTSATFYGNNNFSMRGVGGFAPQPGIQAAIGLVVDDVPLSRQGEFDAELSDIDDVQILTGPQGTLFGPSTTGGVLIVRTKQPTQTFQGYVEASLTSDEEYVGRAVLSGPLSDRVRARAVVYAKHRAGFVDNLYPGIGDMGGEEGRGTRVRFDIDLTERITLDLKGDYSAAEFSTPWQMTLADTSAVLAIMGNGDPALGQRVVSDNTLTNVNADPLQEIEAWGVAATLSWRLNDAFSLKSISSYRDFYLGTHETLDENTPVSPADTMGLPRVALRRSNLALNGLADAEFINEVRYFTEELRLEYTSRAFQWLFGGYYSDNRELLLGELPNVLATGMLSNQPRRGDVELRTWSAFTDLTWHVTDALDLFGGFRWTDESLTNEHLRLTYVVPAGQFSVTESNVAIVNAGVLPISTVAFKVKRSSPEWSGRAGAMWTINPRVNVYASAARGFTGSSANTSQLVHPGGAFLDPSIAISYELGAKAVLFGSRLSLNAALFTTTVDDLQAVRGLTDGTGVVFFNAGTLESNGIELNVNALIGERLTLSGAVTLLDTQLGGGLMQPCYRGQGAQQGCRDFTGDGIAEQLVDGKPALNAPDLKYSATGRYDLRSGSLPFDAYTALTYTWQDRQEYDMVFDPVATGEPNYGLLDLVLGMTTKQGRYEISLFGKNVLNQQFSVRRATVGAGLGRAHAYFMRGSQAYWGVKARLNF